MIERRIILGCILSEEYLQGIKPIWDIQLLESTAAKKICGWAWTHYTRYGKPIGKEIEVIFHERSKRMSKIEIEDIEDILSGLSEESVKNPINVDFLLTSTREYFQDRRLSTISDTVEALLSSGDREEAEKIIMAYTPLKSILDGVNNFVLSIDEIRKNKKPKPKLLLRPWLREGQTTILYGNYGSGKSLLTILVAYILGVKDNDTDDCEIGEWNVNRRTGTLYIDGELGEQEMEERIAQFEWIGEQDEKYKMKILSIPEYQMATEDSFFLGERKNQMQIVQWLKDNPNYKLLILDSASTLFGLKEENDNSEWSNKINPFLRDLRALGVACLLLHHAGKNNKKGLRGASAMGAMAHNIYRIEDHGDKKDGEAWFILTKDKQRGAGHQFPTFSLHFSQSNDEKETHWVYKKQIYQK